jgi:uncharacterized protein
MALSRKFKSLDYYSEVLSPGYKLLPFNFHKLSKDRYLIANMVGEHLIVDRALLVDLVDGAVTAKHLTYNDLKAKHFIMDEDSTVAVDLLALKFRTKRHAVSQFTALHIFVVTLRCDYSCKYCQVSRRMEGDDSFDMSEETAQRSLELAFMSPSNALKIEFQGGEPLLNFPLIKFIVKRAVEINAVARKSLQFVITTNLTFITDEVLQFCEKHAIYLSTSLDGPADLHNKNRPRPDKDGYERTIAGIKKVQAFLGTDAVSALMTTTEESLSRSREIIDEYVAQGFHTIFLRPLSPYGFAIKTKQTEKYNIANWMNFYREGMAYILELNKAGYSLVEQYTAIILEKILTPSNSGYVDLQSPAGIGISAVVYNYDGDVYASDEARMLKEMGDTIFRLGSVHDNSYEEIFSADILLNTLEESLAESAPMCSDCGLISYCGTDPVYHYATQGDVVGKKPLSFFCRKNTAVIEHIFNLLDDAENRSILESWAQ